jgi:hypothetical protein
VYNRYIGNTGTYHRVEEPPNVRVLRERNARQGNQPMQQAARQAAAAQAAAEKQHIDSRQNAYQQAAPAFGPAPQGGPHTGPREPRRQSIPSLSSLFGFKNKPSLSGGGGLLGFLDHLLPAGIDAGDLLLLLFLLFFFLESGDDEFLIILAVIAFSIFKDR